VPLRLIHGQAHLIVATIAWSSPLQLQAWNATSLLSFFDAGLNTPRFTSHAALSNSPQISSICCRKRVVSIVFDKRAATAAKLQAWNRNRNVTNFSKARGELPRRTRVEAALTRTPTVCELQVQWLGTYMWYRIACQWRKDGMRYTDAHNRLRALIAFPTEGDSVACV